MSILYTSTHHLEAFPSWPPSFLMGSGTNMHASGAPIGAARLRPRRPSPEPRGRRTDCELGWPPIAIRGSISCRTVISLRKVRSRCFDVRSEPRSGTVAENCRDHNTAGHEVAMMKRRVVVGTFVRGTEYARKINEYCYPYCNLAAGNEI